MKVLLSAKVEYIVVNAKTIRQLLKKALVDGSDMELMPHQKKAVENLRNGKILYGGVGTGKSLTALAYYMKAEAPKDIYIITTAKKRDSLEWEREAAKLGIGPRVGATVAGRLIVDSWNNIKKYIKTEDAFFIFDEQRLVGSGAWVKTFLKITANNEWILLTATPGDTWLDYIPVFIANGFYRNATEFKREHVIYAPYTNFPKVQRYVGEGTLEKYRNMLLVEMPYLKHTTRHVNHVMVEYDKEKYTKLVKERWNIFEDEPIKDVGELFRLMRKLVNTDQSRVQALDELVNKHRKVIVFYNFDYELEILRTFHWVAKVAEWNGHKKEPIPDHDSWIYLVQYTAGAEGWNCIETDCMVFWSLSYSWKNIEQAQGRIDRLNTPFKDLYYYMFMSNSSIDQAVKKALANKQTFNEMQYYKENMELVKV